MPPYPDDGYDEPTLADDVAEYALALHARGRRATAGRRHIEGSVCRQIANDLRNLIGSTPLAYDGTPESRPIDPWNP
jgi:hypothetical protein